MYHLVYKITNLIDGKFYIGKHSTEDIEDGYMGSGLLIRNAIKKHGVTNFKREILEICKTSAEAFAKEAKYCCLQVVENPLCYNLIVGGGGGGLINVTKKKDIYIINAPSVEVPEKWRLNKSVKYSFQINEKEMDKWRLYLIMLKARRKKEEHAAVFERVTEMLIDMFPQMLKNLEPTYNNIKTHKAVQKLFARMEQKNIRNCFHVIENAWA